MIVKGVKLDEFTQAYLEAALFATNDESTPEGGEPLDKNYGFQDFSEETLRKMAADCAAFRRKFSDEQIEESHLQAEGEYNAIQRAGHDFWMTREGHGVGFWETYRWGGRIAQEMDEFSKQAREFYLEVGDDGQIHGFGGKDWYLSTGSCESGKFEIVVSGRSPADAFVEVGLSLPGDVTIETLVDMTTGLDKLDEIDPNDPEL